MEEDEDRTQDEDHAADEDEHTEEETTEASPSPSPPPHSPHAPGDDVPYDDALLDAYSSPHGLPEPEKKHGGSGSTLFFLLVAFFACFVYQQYLKNRPSGRNRDELEGTGLMDFCRPARSALGNRASDMLDRRRDQSLTTHDYGRNRHGHDDDDDGML